MAGVEPTPGNPDRGHGPRSATAATFQVSDKSLKDLHSTWRMLIKDVKDFNVELQALTRGGKVVDQIAAKLGAIGVGGRGGTAVGTVAGGSRMPGTPEAPAVPEQRQPSSGSEPEPAQEGGAGNPNRPPLSGGASPWKRRIEGALALATATSLFYARRMDDISSSDLFFNQQAQNTGGGYRGSEKSQARNQMFGLPGGRGPGGGLTGYQSVQDALGGAQTVLGATGGRVGGRGWAQLREAGNLAALTPDMGLQGSGNAVASLYDPATSARMMATGVGASIGPGGQLQSPSMIYQNILRTVYRGRRPTAEMIRQGMQPGAPLYLTLTRGMGLGPEAIEQFERYAIAQANLGGNASETNRAVALASKWMSGGQLSKSEQALVGRAGLTDSVRAGQNAQGAAGARQTIEAGREAEDTLREGFHKLAGVTDTLTNTFKRLNDITGGGSGQLLGGAALASGAVNSAFQAIGGVGGGMFAYQAVRQMTRRGAGAAAGAAAEGGPEAAAAAAGEAFGAQLGIAAGPIGIGIAAAFIAHVSGNWLKRDAANRGGIAGAAEDVVGTHLSSAWKIGINPAGYAKDVYSDVRKHASWLPKLPKIPGFGHGFADGGVVPGHHDRDDVDIKATPGELVVPKPVVHLHGGADALMRKLGFRGQGQDGHYAYGGEVVGDTKGLNTEFFKRLKAFSASVGEPFRVGSGYRSLAEQQVLYDRWMRRVPGQARAAKPGSSEHNFGLAADGPHWAGKGPSRFGLVYPMSFEPWHIEPIGAKAMRGGGAVSGADVPVADSGDGTDLGRMFLANVSSPGVLSDEKSAMAVFLARANDPYGIGGTQKTGGIEAAPPKSSGIDSSNPKASGAHAPSNPKGNVALGRSKAAARGWTGAEWDALYQLWNKESGWRTDAANPTSSARGIAQTMMSVHFGKSWKTDPAAKVFMSDAGKQIDWGLNYIAQRYRQPTKAWEHSQKLNWYDVGAWETDDEYARLHRGEMVVPAPTAKKMRAAVQSRGQQVQSAGTISMPTPRGDVRVSISMPVQLIGQATQRDAEHLVSMVADRLEENDVLARLGTGG